MESDGGSTKRGVEFDDDQVNGGGNVMKRRGVVFADGCFDIDGGGNDEGCLGTWVRSVV